MKRYHAVTILALPLVSLACSHSEAEEVGAIRQAISNGGAIDVSASANLPEAAVVRLRVLRGGRDENTCTGTILENVGRGGGGVILTAAHCFCGTPGGIEAPTQIVSVDRPGSRGAQMSAQVAVKFYGSESVACQHQFRPFPPRAAYVNNGNLGGLAISDLAVVQMPMPFSVPKLPRVFTGDFITRARDFDHPLIGHRVTGSGTSVSGPVVLMQGNLDPFKIDHLSVCTDVTSLFSCNRYIIRIDRDQGSPSLDGGDSGGPLTFMRDDGVAVVYGVASGMLELYNDDLYSPTYENGDGNGAFLRSFLTDADEDGVDDAIDNCPPSRCLDNPLRCANPDQADADGDGVGDACDNCPPSVCTDRGWPLAACSNRLQIDADGDGTGDVCDSCPALGNGTFRRVLGEQFDDEDKDGVGAACDNCGNPNAFRACRTAFDCDGARCILSDIPVFGRCTVTGKACLTNTDCTREQSFSACERPTAPDQRYGRCERQLDDVDHDGLGGSCDLCPNLNDARITVTSNVEAESRHSVKKLADHCDPVPQSVSKAIVGRVDLKTGKVLDEVGSARDYTTFRTTLGLGQGATISPVAARAGFRYCSCVAGEVQDRDTCMKELCAPMDFSYEMDMRFVPASTATSLDLAVAPVDDPAVRGDEYARVFTPEILPREPRFSHRTYVDDYRLGDQQQITLWRHALDPLPFVGGKSAAVFLSHVVYGPEGTVSDRDRDNRGLRDSLDYVGLPLVDFVDFALTRQFTDCVLSGCMMWWRPDWAILPPDVYRERSTPLDLVAHYGRLASQADGTIAVLGRPSDPAMDVTRALSPGTRALLSSTGVSFLTPVEEGVTGARGMLRPAYAAMAQPWRQAAVRPTALFAVDGTILTIDEANDRSKNRLGLAAATEAEEPRLVPGDRDASRAVLSGSDGAIYMVGGHFLDGARTGEVLRYSIASDEWTSVFGREPMETVPGDVRAIAYDERSRKIVVLDEGISETNGLASERAPGQRIGRILVIDLAARTIHVAASRPRADAYARIGLVHRGDGEFLLVRAHKNQARYTSFAFRLGATGDAEWIGKAQADGEVLDDPIRTSRGVLLPVARGGVQDIDLLTVQPSGAGPADL